MARRGAVAVAIGIVASMMVMGCGGTSTVTPTGSEGTTGPTQADPRDGAYSGGGTWLGSTAPPLPRVPAAMAVTVPSSGVISLAYPTCPDGSPGTIAGATTTPESTSPRYSVYLNCGDGSRFYGTVDLAGTALITLSARITYEWKPSALATSVAIYFDGVKGGTTEGHGTAGSYPGSGMWSGLHAAPVTAVPPAVGVTMPSPGLVVLSYPVCPDGTGRTLVGAALSPSEAWPRYNVYLNCDDGSRFYGYMDHSGSPMNALSLQVIYEWKYGTLWTRNYLSYSGAK